MLLRESARVKNMLLTPRTRWMTLSQPRTRPALGTPPGRVEIDAEIHPKAATQERLKITQNINVLPCVLSHSLVRSTMPFERATAAPSGKLGRSGRAGMAGRSGTGMVC